MFNLKSWFTVILKFSFQLLFFFCWYFSGIRTISLCFTCYMNFHICTPVSKLCPLCLVWLSTVARFRKRGQSMWFKIEVVVLALNSYDPFLLVLLLIFTLSTRTQMQKHKQQKKRDSLLLYFLYCGSPWGRQFPKFPFLKKLPIDFRQKQRKA